MATTTTTIKVVADTSQAQQALGNIQTTLTRFASIAGLSAVAKQLGDVADEATNLKNKLMLVSSGQDYANYTFDKLITIATAARAPLSAVGDLYFSIARSANILGVSNEQARLATELVAKGMTAAGMSAQQASGPLLQLSQAFQSGVFQGDELRSVLEGMPTVSKALADSLGVPVTALKYLGSQGKISGKDVIDAILKAKDVIEKDFAKTVPTIGQAFTVAQTAVTGFVGKLDQTTGASKTIAGAIINISNVLSKLSDDVDAMKKLGETIAFVVGWAVKIGILIASFTLLGWVLRGLGAAALVIRAGWAGIVTIFETVVNAVRGFSMIWANFAEVGVGGSMRVLMSLFKEFGSFLKPLMVPFAAFFGLIWQLIEWVASKWEGFVDSLKSGVNSLTGLVGIQLFDTAATAEAEKALAVANAQTEEQKKLNLLKEDQARKQAEITAKQFQFNEELRKSLETQALNNKYDAMKGTMLDTELAYQRAIAEATKKAADEGVALSAAQATVVGELAKQKVIIDQIQSGISKYRELIPQAGIENTFNQDLINLQAAFQAGRITSEQDYTNAVLALLDQRTIAELDAQDVIMMKQYEIADKKLKLQQNAYEIELRNQQDLLGNLQFGADTAKSIAADRTSFEKKSETEKTAWAIDQAAQLFTAQGQYNRKAFEAAKAFNIANAIMNTYMAATKALATYPPPFGFIGAAAAVAMGLAQVAQISSQSYSGRALGGPVMGNSPYMVGENGPELFTPSTSGQITRNQDLPSGQPVNVNFTIQAVDSRGIDQLLMDRKGTIVSMIRSAINDRGIRAPI